MKKEVIFFVLNNFADWEGAFLACGLNAGIYPKNLTKYTTKFMSTTKEPVISLGGMRILPDYDIKNPPKNYSALILIGGNQWHSKETLSIIPMIRETISKNIILGGICNASLFLGANGFLNNVNHTSNTLKILKEWGKDQYTGELYYKNQQAVSDKNIVTANGTGYLEFTKEILLLLEADTKKNIEQFYDFNKHGFI
ncbi:type 1 glutamine amidotransferase family protein [Fusobacterium sp. PH5-44]|uniref:type 1 glutamine amidotransferase family protein n=1 Tax=unclassified Fusobacterium TaxID=2648384 RepID=UPI003D22510F